MNLKHVSPVSNETEPTGKPGFYAPSEEPNEPVPQIYKRGWDSETPHAFAISKTLDEVEQMYPGREVVGEPEIIETDEHKEANEYLVKVLVL